MSCGNFIFTVYYVRLYGDTRNRTTHDHVYWCYHVGVCALLQLQMPSQFRIEETQAVPGCL